MPGTDLTIRIGLASVRNAATVEERLATVERMLAEAAAQDVAIVCFPEAYIPGLSASTSPSNCRISGGGAALEQIQTAAKLHGVAVVMGMEWESEIGLHNTAVVIGRDDELCGWQVKNQIPPEEEPHYVPDGQRRLFEIGSVLFGIAICHEGWRYPETALGCGSRQAGLPPAANRQRHDRPDARALGRSASPYYEKAMIARAVENVIYFASVNFAFATRNRPPA